MGVEKNVVEGVSKKVPKSSGFINKIGGFNGIANLGFAAMDYSDAKKNGASTIGAVAKAGTNFAFNEMMGGWIWPYMILKDLPVMGIKGAEALGKFERKMSKQNIQTPFSNATFNDFNQAVTMRQAGLQLAEASRYNLQQTLMGNEAKFLR